MDMRRIVVDVADVLKGLDAEGPVQKNKKFRPGIGPFGEPQLVRKISVRLNGRDGIYDTKVRRSPDLEINANQWALEFKIVRPFGDNGEVAENWSVNLLHPYEGNTSLIGDAIKLKHQLTEYDRRGVFLIGYEHEVPKISLDPLIESFEVVMREVIRIRLGTRVEERRDHLMHPEHQVVRCVGWEVM